MDVRPALPLFASLLALCVSAPAVAQSHEGKDLVRKIAYMPAHYTQACDLPRRDPSLAVVVNFGGRSTHSEFAISAEQFAQLRDKRVEVIKDLHDWLKNATAEGADEKREVINREEITEEVKRHLRGEYIPYSPYIDAARNKLLMLVDLNDVSALPLLSAYARKWYKIYREASPLTEVDWGSLRAMDEKALNDISMKARAQDRLGDILSAIIAILRQEQFERVLSSQLEKDAEAKMTEKVAPWLQELRRRVNENSGEIIEQERALVFGDPVNGIPITLWAYPKLTISDETVVEILSWIDEYQKLPAKKRLDAKGMMPWPINR